MNRIAHAERLRLVVVGPLRRIVVQPDRRAALRGIDVMHQSEMLEAQLPGNGAQCVAQLVGIGGRLDDAGKLQRSRVQHHPFRPRPRAASQAAVYPAAVLSPCFAPAGGSSRRLPAIETVVSQKHIGRTPEIKMTGPLRWSARS